MAVDFTCRMGLSLGVQGLVVRRSPGYIEPIGECPYAESPVHNLFQFSTVSDTPYKATAEEMLSTSSALVADEAFIHEQRRRAKVFWPWVKKMKAGEECLNSPSGNAQFLGARSVIAKARPVDTDIYNCARDKANAVFLSARGGKKRDWNYNSAFLREVFTFLDMAAISSKVPISDSTISLHGLQKEYDLSVPSDDVAFGTFFSDGQQCTENMCGREKVSRRQILLGAEWFIDPVGGRSQEELRLENEHVEAFMRSSLRQPPHKRGESIVSEHSTSNFLRLGQFAKGLIGTIPADIIEEVENDWIFITKASKSFERDCNFSLTSLIFSQVSDDLEARHQSKEMARPPLLRGLSKRSKAPKQFCDGCDEAAADIDLLSKDVDTDFDDVCFFYTSSMFKFESDPVQKRSFINLSTRFKIHHRLRSSCGMEWPGQV